MYRLNPNALVFWTICALAGYLFGGTRIAMMGLLFGMIASLLASLGE